MEKDILAPKDGEICLPKVCKSNAGYYIGTEYWDAEVGAWLPNERLSSYYPTKEKAEEMLGRFYYYYEEAN